MRKKQLRRVGDMELTIRIRRTLMEVQSGSLLQNKNRQHSKRHWWNAGRQTGVIDYKKRNRIGAISINSVEGIFTAPGPGRSGRNTGQNTLRFGLKQRVKEKLTDLSCLEGRTGATAASTIEIKALHLDTQQHQPWNRESGNG